MDMERKGSKTTEVSWQTGHTRVDLNWPRNRDSTTESFLCLCFCQNSSATSCNRHNMTQVYRHVLDSSMTVQGK